MILAFFQLVLFIVKFKIVIFNYSKYFMVVVAKFMIAMLMIIKLQVELNFAINLFPGMDSNSNSIITIIIIILIIKVTITKIRIMEVMVNFNIHSPFNMQIRMSQQNIMQPIIIDIEIIRKPVIIFMKFWLMVVKRKERLLPIRFVLIK